MAVDKTQELADEKQSLVKQFETEVNEFLVDPATIQSLISTTFTKLTPQLVKRALLEGRFVGFTFENFLKKDVYAIPFKNSYALVTSVGYARKLGQRNGIVGKSAPQFECDEKGKVVSCTVTVQKKTGNHIGDFSATVYFDEYYKSGYNGKPSLWDTKPRTMIAKVAEQHALRMACPEDMSNMYIQEEFDQESGVQEGVVIDEETVTNDADVVEVDPAKKDQLEACKTLQELQNVWSSLTAQEKSALSATKDELKEKLSKKKETKANKK